VGSVIVNCQTSSTAVLVLLHVGVVWWTEVVVSPVSSCVPRVTASGRGFAHVPSPVASTQVPPGVHPIWAPHAPQLPPHPSSPHAWPSQFGVQLSWRQTAQLGPIGMCSHVWESS
jgi:hypothetical protein